MSYADYVKAEQQYINGTLGTEGFLLVLNTIFSGREIDDKLTEAHQRKIARKSRKPRRRRASKVVSYVK